MKLSALARPDLPVELERPQAAASRNYTRWQMLSIGVFAALPVALLAWVVALAIIPYSPLPGIITLCLLLVAGTAWALHVSRVIIYPDVCTLRCSADRQGRRPARQAVTDCTNN